MSIRHWKSLCLSLTLLAPACSTEGPPGASAGPSATGTGTATTTGTSAATTTGTALPTGTAATPPLQPGKAAAIAHGGVGSPPTKADGCRSAVDAALRVLEKGGEPIDAAVAGVVVLEDDPRFNAGTGSIVRIDGKTVQMDASVMTSEGRFGGVAVIEHVKNPVKVAQAVLKTPHLLIAGDGATRYARALGMPFHDPSTEETRALTRSIQERLRRADPSLPEPWNTPAWRSVWNYESTLEQAGFGAGLTDAGTDTVGVAVRGADGRFAVALSTGGTSITLRGRVGDVPILGAGLFADRNGAVAATGKGERIMEAGLGRAAVGWLGAGTPPADVATRAVEQIRGKGDVGIIVIGTSTMAAAADRPMAWAARELGSTEWKGPAPEGEPRTTK